MAQQGFWEWADSKPQHNYRYVCGHCGTDIHSRLGYFAQFRPTQTEIRIGINRILYICPSCMAPTYIDERGNQVPGAPFGKPVTGVPTDLGQLYESARNCMRVGACASAALTCRKILMHVAVNKGAEPGKNFTDYVTHLAEKNYIPQGATEWVDLIRRQGNHANHEIWMPERREAEDLLYFTQMLLTFVYEIPARLPKKA